MTHVTCRLTAKNRNQLRNPTLSNRVWASFTFFAQPLPAWITWCRLVVGCQTSSQLVACMYVSSADRRVHVLLGSVLHNQHRQRHLHPLRPVRPQRCLPPRPSAGRRQTVDPVPTSDPPAVLHTPSVPRGQRTCHLDPLLFSLFVWLGYINSFLNPLIYTIFNVEFRRAFNNILRQPCRRAA